MNQRWRERRMLFRRPEEQIRKENYRVLELPDDRLAKAFVVKHHYSGTYPAARFRFGLVDTSVSVVRDASQLLGVAVFSHPCNNRVLTNVFEGPVLRSVELGRLVLLDEVPGNGESFFVAQCFAGLRRKGVAGVVSFSDPVPRTGADGRLVMPGHVGSVYQALEASYLGRSTPRTLRLLPDGSVFSDRAAQKIRGLEQGWEYSVGQLVRQGAEYSPYLTLSEAHRREWLAKALATLTRPMKHPGNHRYAWRLLGRRLPVDPKSYPKKGARS